VCLTGASDEPVHGSKKADYRLHYVVESFTPGGGDAPERYEAGREEGIGAGNVVTGDRAYGNIRGIEYLRGCGSDFVIRLKSGAFAVYTKEGEQREVLEYFEYPGEGESGEEEDEGRKRLEKTNRKKGYGEVSGRQEACNRYVVVATSLEGVSAARIPDCTG
jgi:hypothetical protein